MKAGFFENGYAVYDVDPGIARWAQAAWPLSDAALGDQDLRDRWLVCEGTWFVGVDALPTGPQGQAGTVPLTGPVIDDLAAYTGDLSPLHRAQLSVTFPGYPKPREGEGEAAFRYRQTRDAAHVDGLHAMGPQRRRHLGEFHGYILGLPLNAVAPEASPLVVWQGSHRIFQQMFRQALDGVPVAAWPDIDLTEVYQATRRRVFAECPRMPLPARPGQAVVLHRMALHGVAPWTSEVPCPEGRRVAYFRPGLADPSLWLSLP